MESETAKNLISRIRQSDLDDEAQEEAIRQVKAERAKGKPAAYLSVSGGEDRMGGSAKLRLGERTPVTVHLDEDEVEPPDEDDEDPTYASRVFLELTRLDGHLSSGEGTGSSTAYDDGLIMADYHLTYGQAKALLRLVDPENSPGTPGDCGSRIRHVLGPPEDVNPLLRALQENGVRGWRTL